MEKLANPERVRGFGAPLGGPTFSQAAVDVFCLGQTTAGHESECVGCSSKKKANMAS